MIVSASSLCVRFGAEEVFDDVTFNINRGERTALVGVNGAGKTTLFRLLAGELEPSEGELHIPEGTTVQCLQQQMSNFPDGPLQKTVCRQAGKAAQALRKMEKVSRKLEHAEGDSEKKKLLKSLARAQDLADSTEAFSLKSRSERVLAGLGFSMDEFDKPLEDLSGGWRMRARLASLLLSDPDLLLLDEPTNHLDLDARIWLEEYLSSFGGAVWIISHDPGFLDRVVENVCELEFGKLTCYSGNYSFYSRAKQEEVRRREKMAKHQAEQIEKIQRFIKRFKATESKRFQVRSREKMLEKMEIIQTHRDPSHMKLRFPEPPRSGRIVARLEDAGKAYEKTVFEDVSLEILRGDRVGIVGKNGQGKSTLARVLAGTEELSCGTLKIGANVETGFYSQEADRSMEPELNLLDQLFAVSPDSSEGELRSILGAFLFTGDDVFKKTRVLSGGEKSRLALASILLKPVNLLILDEPTNHLDMFSRDVLCEALEGYTGTLVLISHDEKLLSSTVNKVFEVGGGEVKPFHGTFDYYLRKKQEKIRKEFGRGDDPGSEKSSPRENRKENKRQEAAQRKKKYKERQKLQKRLDRIEGKLMPLEEKASELEKMLADPEVLSSSSRLVKLQKEHAYLSQKIQEYRDMWDEIADGMEDI